MRGLMRALEQMVLLWTVIRQLCVALLAIQANNALLATVTSPWWDTLTGRLQILLGI